MSVSLPPLTASARDGHPLGTLAVAGMVDTRCRRGRRPSA